MAKVTLELDIDWAMLKNQKQYLLSTLSYFEALSSLTSEQIKQVDALEGILNLIDGIQAYAVDSGQFKENDVFNLSDN